MPIDWLAGQVAWLHEFRKENMVEPVVYVQDGIDHGLDMTILRGDSDTNDELGILINSRFQDFAVDVQEYKALGIRDPEHGDRIVRQLETETITYELAGGQGEPAFRPMTRYRMAWRIHTVRVDYAYITPP